MFKATTILCVQKDGKTAMGGDGQVSLGDAVVKGTARKIRRLCWWALPVRRPMPLP